MGFHKRVTSALLAVIMICSLCVSSVLAEENKKQNNGEVTILFTHDIHSRLDEYKTRDESGETVMAGGLARMKTEIDRKKAENPATFVFDGGDFSMGTLYQTIYETQASELTMLGRLGVDATTFGNHEFDYRSQGVSDMLHSAIRNGQEDDTLTLPKLLVANIDWEKNHSEENQVVQKALEDYGSSDYAVIEREGVRIGVYGVVGEDAEACAPESGIDFDDIIETSKRVVKELQAEDVDMIVCLSHSGTSEDADKSEDELLAKAVPEIDVIISGHTHTALEEPILCGDTVIASAGCYGKNLGEVSLIPDGDGGWQVEEYQLKAMDESVEPSEEIEEYLTRYRDMIEEEYLSQFGYRMDQTLAENEIAFTQIDDFSTELKEDTLGSLIADAYIYSVEQAEGEDYIPVDLAVVPSGVVRDSFQKGEITVSDAFNVSALGIGADRTTGYPLVSVYLTGAELKTVAEIDASISPIMTYAQLYPSGMRWSYNPNRLILNRVTETIMTEENADQDGVTYQAIQDDRLYRVVSGLYSAQMLGAVEAQSKGILKLTPKNAEGEPITDFEAYIIHDQKGAEVKEWYALASYLESFDKNEEGVSQIPERYAAPEGRKTEQDSKNIIDLLKNPNKIAAIVYTLVVALAALIVLVIWLCYTKKTGKKKRRR